MTAGIASLEEVSGTSMPESINQLRPRGSVIGFPRMVAKRSLALRRNPFGRDVADDIAGDPTVVSAGK
jgi:hypothetical protein